MQDILYENKIMRDQLKCVKQELQSSEKRQSCVTTAFKEESESMPSCSHSLVQSIREFIDNSCTTKSPPRERRNANKNMREFVDDDCTAKNSLRVRSFSQFSARRPSRREWGVLYDIRTKNLCLQGGDKSAKQERWLRDDASKIEPGTGCAAAHIILCRGPHFVVPILSPSSIPVISRHIQLVRTEPPRHVDLLCSADSYWTRVQCTC